MKANPFISAATLEYNLKTIIFYLHKSGQLKIIANDRRLFNMTLYSDALQLYHRLSRLLLSTKLEPAHNRKDNSKSNMLITRPWNLLNLDNQLKLMEVHIRDERIYDHGVYQSDDGYGIDCLNELMGYGGATLCTITDECWQNNIKEDLQGHKLVRQILYFMLANELKCYKQIKQRLHHHDKYHDIVDLLRAFCSYAYREVKTLYEKFDMKVIRAQQIFMEEIIFCAASGFSDFYDYNFIKQVFQYQSFSGCFSTSVLRRKIKSVDQNVNSQAYCHRLKGKG